MHFLSCIVHGRRFARTCLFVLALIVLHISCGAPSFAAPANSYVLGGGGGGGAGDGGNVGSGGVGGAGGTVNAFTHGGAGGDGSIGTNLPTNGDGGGSGGAAVNETGVSGIPGLDGGSFSVNGQAGGNAVGTDTGTRHYGSVYVLGGQGGADGSVGNGGAGGGAALTTLQHLTVDTELRIESGLAPGGPGAVGGAAGFDVDHLNAPTNIYITKNSGALSSNVDIMDVLTNNTTLHLNNTAAGEVNFDTVNLGRGNTFSITNTNNGAATFDILNARYGAGALNVSNTDVAFDTVNLGGPDMAHLKVISSAVTGSLSVAHLYAENSGGVLASSVNTTRTNFTIGDAHINDSYLYLDNTIGGMRIADLSIGRQGILGQATAANTVVDALYAAPGAQASIEMPVNVRNGQMMVPVTDGVDIRNAKMGVYSKNKLTNITHGDRMTLLAADSNKNGVGVLQAGGINTRTMNAKRQVFRLTADSHNLYATYTLDQYQSLAEARLAGLVNLNSGSDLLVNSGIEAAQRAAKTEDGLTGFTAVSGGSSRTDTGSHVDVDGVNALVGLAWGADVGPGKLTAGVFMEGGWGSYSTFNSFSLDPDVDGDGNTQYIGGGILARYDHTDGALKGAYAEASFRAGQVKTDFDSSDILVDDVGTSFDSSAAYYGAHGGVGYLWDISDKARLDLSAKLLWTRQGSDDLTVDYKDIHFDDADSLRTRLGGRFSYVVVDAVKPYAGAYWEHEFDGDQKMTVDGYDPGTPSLQGDTAVGELGLIIVPVAGGGFSLDLGVQGYTGQREGVTGALQLKYEF